MEMRANDDPLIVRFNERVRAWRATVESSFETESSLIGFGRQSDRAVVVKVVKRPGDEWNSGRMLEAFDGQGMARVYEHVEGAMLLERLEPSTSLSTLVVDGRDEEATDIVADVISRIKRTDAPPSTPTAKELARAFDWYRKTGDAQIPPGSLIRPSVSTTISRIRKTKRDCYTATYSTTTFCTMRSADGLQSIQKESSASSSTKSARVSEILMRRPRFSARRR